MKTSYFSESSILANNHLQFFINNFNYITTLSTSSRFRLYLQ